eukprot:11827641-Ditylum_brightwellii.AAC.1
MVQWLEINRILKGRNPAAINDDIGGHQSDPTGEPVVEFLQQENLLHSHPYLRQSLPLLHPACVPTSCGQCVFANHIYAVITVTFRLCFPFSITKDHQPYLSLPEVQTVLILAVVTRVAVPP